MACPPPPPPQTILPHTPMCERDRCAHANHTNHRTFRTTPNPQTHTFPPLFTPHNPPCPTPATHTHGPQPLPTPPLGTQPHSAPNPARSSHSTTSIHRTTQNTPVSPHLTPHNTPHRTHPRAWQHPATLFPRARYTMQAVQHAHRPQPSPVPPGAGTHTMGPYSSRRHLRASRMFQAPPMSCPRLPPHPTHASRPCSQQTTDTRHPCLTPSPPNNTHTRGAASFFTHTNTKTCPATGPPSKKNQNEKTLPPLFSPSKHPKTPK